MQNLQQKNNPIHPGITGLNCDLSPTILSTEGSLNKQVGGDHYKKNKIQPIEYILANKLDWCEANVVKLVTRWKDKNGIQDIDKAIHYLQILKEQHDNP